MFTDCTEVLTKELHYLGQDDAVEEGDDIVLGAKEFLPALLQPCCQRRCVLMTLNRQDGVQCVHICGHLEDKLTCDQVKYQILASAPPVLLSWPGGHSAALPLPVFNARYILLKNLNDLCIKELFCQ